MGKQIKVLEHHADVLANLVDIYFLVRDIIAVHYNSAAVNALQPVQAAKECGLSTSGRADNNDNLSVLYLGAYVL